MFRSVRMLLSAVAVLPVLAFAQAPSVNPVRSVEADVKLALRDAQRLADTEPSKALERLKKLLTSLESDHVLPADRRAQLTRIVNDQIRVAQAGPAVAIDPKDVPLTPAAAKRAEEFAKIRFGIRDAAALARQGKMAEANAKATELVKQFPDNVVVQTLTEINQTTAKRDEAHTVRKEKEQSALTVLAGVDRAAVMPKDDIVYSKDFKEKTAKRLADTAPTAEELRTLKALNSEITPRFNGSRLEDVIDYLSTVTGLPIMIDKSSLDDLGISYDTKVTLALKRPVAVRTVLRAVLRQVGLTFVARDGVVYAASQARAREYLVTKVYTVADLVIPVDPREGNRLLNALMFMDLIVNTVDPDSWEQRGGAGVIRYYDPTFAIVIRQSAEVHAQMRGGRSAP